MSGGGLAEEEAGEVGVVGESQLKREGWGRAEQAPFVLATWRGCHGCRGGQR